MGRRKDTLTIPLPGLLSDEPKYGTLKAPQVIAPASSIVVPQPKSIIIERPEMRDYQERAVKALLWAISAKNPNRSDRAAALMATGTGKSLVGCELARRVSVEFGRRVLIVCNQKELINQWIDKLDLIGISALREQAQNRALPELAGRDNIVVVASQQTMVGNRLESWPKNYFDLIIHDECDLCLSPTWKNLFSYFDARHVGLTATPDRLDGSYITELFPVIPEGAIYPLARAVAEGWAINPITHRAMHEAIDLTKLKVTGGDFNKKELDEIIRANVGGLAEASIPLMNSKATIAFTPTVFTAYALAEAYNQMGVAAIAVSSDSPDVEGIFAAFRRREFQVLVNCGMVSRGIDFPFVENVVMARPTASRALYCQQVGRATRPYLDEDTGYVKKEARIIDFAWKFQKKNHKLAHPTDLYRTLESDEQVMEQARLVYDRMKEERPEQEPDRVEVLNIAIDELKKQLRERIKFERKNIIARVTVVDTLLMDILAVPTNPATNWMNKKAPTEAQIRALQGFGVKTESIADLSMQGASRMLDELSRRRKAGLASWPQVRTMINCKLDPDEANKMSMQEAKMWLDANLPLQPWYGKRK